MLVKSLEVPGGEQRMSRHKTCSYEERGVDRCPPI
jgi:hypothetical protein